MPKRSKFSQCGKWSNRRTGTYFHTISSSSSSFSVSLCFCRILCVCHQQNCIAFQWNDKFWTGSNYGKQWINLPALFQFRKISYCRHNRFANKWLRLSVNTIQFRRRFGYFHVIHTDVSNAVAAVCVIRYADYCYPCTLFTFSWSDLIRQWIVSKIFAIINFLSLFVLHGNNHVHFINVPALVRDVCLIEFHSKMINILVLPWMVKVCRNLWSRKNSKSKHKHSLIVENNACFVCSFKANQRRLCTTVDTFYDAC